MSQAVKKVFASAKVMFDRHGLAKVTSKSSILAEEPERRILRDYCRDIWPRNSLSIYILGLWPNLRTRSCPKRGYLCQKRLH